MSKLWDKGKPLDKKIEKFTVGNDNALDQKLVEYDCKASIAHAKMLREMHLISSEEADRLIHELKKIIDEEKNGKFIIKIEDEDSHSAIENRLIKSLGEVGSKIHIARSRNDQVLVALRLYYKDSINKIYQLTEKCISTIHKFGNKHHHDFPGYTHMQKAMPSSIDLWAKAYADALTDDLKTLENTLNIVDQNPLGSAAGYPLSIDIDRELTTRELNFKTTQSNSIYCQLSRGKFELLIIDSFTQIMLTLNRLSSDIILFSMPQFGYFEIPEKYCTGSSIMPQKKNPDVLELIRAKYHILLGYGSSVRSITSNLISGYNRDLQLIKEPIIEGMNIVYDCLDIMNLIFVDIKVNKDRCLSDLSKDLYATEEVYGLVKKGIPFRKAYRQIAKKFNSDLY